MTEFVMTEFVITEFVTITEFVKNWIFASTCFKVYWLILIK